MPLRFRIMFIFYLATFRQLRLISEKRITKGVKGKNPVLILGAVVTEQNEVKPQDSLSADRDMNKGKKL
jgi:hypothetical protein